MSEDSACAKPATKPEPPRESSTENLPGALYALAKAMEAQTCHLASLAESLSNLTEHLASLVDQLEDDRDSETHFDTLS
jgi:cysteine sulfinate desulfinase/cysteine desulfurase-like protein